MGRLSPEQVAAWVIATCEAQGVPLKISDRLAVQQVSIPLGGASARTEPARQRGEGAPDTPPTAATPD